MKVFQSICQYIALALFVALFGIIGGIDQGLIRFGSGAVLAVLDLLLTAAFAYFGGMFYGQK